MLTPEHSKYHQQVHPADVQRDLLKLKVTAHTNSLILTHHHHHHHPQARREVSITWKDPSVCITVLQHPKDFDLLAQQCIQRLRNQVYTHTHTHIETHIHMHIDMYMHMHLHTLTGEGAAVEAPYCGRGAATGVGPDRAGD